MKNFAEIYYIFTISCILLHSGFMIQCLSYDYSATTKCLVKPQRPHYNGGIKVNPDFKQNLEGWTVSGNGKIKEGISSEDGNRFIVAYNRSASLDSIFQKVQLEKGKLYSFSAWIQISEGSETVDVIFKTANGEKIHGGYVIAKHGCWSLLKGGMVANVSGIFEIIFECKNTTVDIWIDSVSLKPYTMEEWRSNQNKIIDKVRKTKVRLQANYGNRTLEKAVISIKQTKPSFPFGCGMNHNILTIEKYKNWFASRFKYTTFTNEMKWYSTENVEGQENYAVADEMLKFAKENGISVRGHNILWDDPYYQPQWVKSLSGSRLKEAAMRRANSVTKRYSGQLIAWDVMNENLHFRFFENNLGENASAEFYATAYHLDPQTTMFMNEYNTIEYSGDEAARPDKYIKKLNDILSYPENKGMLAGIGVQGHFTSGQPNLVYMKSALDTLASTGLPIWLTEVDVAKGDNQAQYFEQILREGYSHPAVKGIIIFAGPIKAGFEVIPLADENFKSTPAGDVVDKLINEWKTQDLELVTDSKGFAEVSLFYGDYEITVRHPRTNFSTTLNYKVKDKKFQESINLNMVD